MRSKNLLTSLLLLRLVSAGSVSVQNKPQVRVTTTLANFGTRIMDQWGKGGGKSWTIADNSHHPFVGREFGGAQRRDIRGSNAFGSGYTYGVKDTSMVAGRAFPFGVWPLYWTEDFMGSTTEYGPHLDAVRPGGHLSIVRLRTTRTYFDVSDNEVYYAIGDAQSLLAVLVSYVTWCHADLVWPTRFDPLSPNAVIRLDNVLQYYRASSFALASTSFINPHARNVSYDGTYTISENVRNSAFWQCIDSTTASSLPIIGPPPSDSSTGMIIIMVVFCALAIPLLWLLWYLATVVVKFLCLVRDWAWNYQVKMEEIAARRRQAVETRDGLLRYEQYP